MSSARCDLLCLDIGKAERLRQERLDPAAATAGAVTAKALADPTRLSLAHVLALTDEACVCDLSWVMGRAENLISHHLKILREAGLVTSRRDGRMILYAMCDRGRDLVAAVASDRLPEPVG